MLLFEIGLGLALSYFGAVFVGFLRLEPRRADPGTWLIASLIVIAGSVVTVIVAFGIASTWSIVVVVAWIAALVIGYRRGIAPEDNI